MKKNKKKGWKKKGWITTWLETAEKEIIHKRNRKWWRLDDAENLEKEKKSINNHWLETVGDITGKRDEASDEVEKMLKT